MKNRLKSGGSGTLKSLSLLRTELETFTSYGSSYLKPASRLAAAFFLFFRPALRPIKYSSSSFKNGILSSLISRCLLIFMYPAIISVVSPLLNIQSLLPFRTQYRPFAHCRDFIGCLRRAHFHNTLNRTPSRS